MDKSKEIKVTQPYDLTNGCYNWSPLMCNIVGMIIYHATVSEENKNTELFGESYLDKYHNHILEIPVKTIHGDIAGIGKKSRNYQAIIDAVKKLWNNPIVIKHANGSTEYRQIITSVTDKIQKGRVKLEISQGTWEYFQGIDTYTRFDLIKWLSFDSFYSKRLSLLAKAWEKPIRYNADTILEMFNLPKNYVIGHIVSKIFKPAQSELEEKNDISFNYRKIFESSTKCGRPRLIGFLLWQIKKEQPENSWIFSESKMIAKIHKEGLKAIFDEDTLTDILHTGFRKEEVEANIYTLYHITLRYNIKTLIEQLEEELQDLEEETSVSFENHKGYYIKRMKKILEKEEEQNKSE